MEKALPVGDLLADLQPRVFSQHGGDGSHLAEGNLVVLGVVQLGPGGLLAPHPSAALGLTLRHRAEQRLQRAEPLVTGGRRHLRRDRPEPQGGPGVHHPPQPSVGAAGVGQAGLDLLAPHRAAADPNVVQAPHVDGPADLCLGHLQPAPRQRPQRLDPLG